MGRLRMLIIDDEVFVETLAKRLRSGGAIDVVCSGDDGLARLREEGDDVVRLDCGCPIWMATRCCGGSKRSARRSQ